MNPIDFFLAHRVPVFPIRPGTKQPATHGDWAKWDDFARPRPSVPYGVVLGRLLVVDADSPATAAWVAAHVPPTPFTVESGPYHDGATGRGCHHYFRAPDHMTPAYIHRDALVIEARRAGQYVVGPTSPHPSGKHIYTASEWSWRWDDLPTFPADFVFSDSSALTSVEGAPYAPPTRMQKGERSHELFRLVRHLKARGASIETTRYTVALYNRERCEPPKSDEWLNNWFPRAWGHRDRADFGQWDIDTPPEDTDENVVKRILASPQADAFIAMVRDPSRHQPELRMLLAQWCGGAQLERLFSEAIAS